MSTGVAVRNLLLNGQAGPRVNPTQHPQSTGLPPSTWYLPGGRCFDAEWVDWVILIQSLQGAPTTASIRFGFEIGLPTTHGDVQPQPAPGTYNFSYTDAYPAWQPISVNSHPHMLPDGPWPAVAADETLTGEVMLLRRIRGGVNHRVRVDSSYTGGTNPAFILTVEQIQRY